MALPQKTKNNLFPKELSRGASSSGKALSRGASSRIGAKKMPAATWDGMGWWGHAVAYRNFNEGLGVVFASIFYQLLCVVAAAHLTIVLLFTILS